MKVLIFGATGMVGQGVLRECLLDPAVTSVQSIGRTSVDQQNPKLHDLVHADMWNYATIENQLSGFDACFFCLGVSSGGMSEEKYAHLTYDLTMAAAETLARLNPQMTMIYVSGASTDSSEQGKSMWARVKGKTENALLRLPFKAAYMFRPGAIQPLHGIKSKTPAYRILYSAVGFLFPLLRAMFPRHVLTTEQIGRAMIAVARKGYRKPILESTDLYEVSGGV